jgi:gluconate kinase
MRHDSRPRRLWSPALTHTLTQPVVAVVMGDLKGSNDLIGRRVAARHQHFMPVALLDSQFATLQEPTPDERPA